MSKQNDAILKLFETGSLGAPENAIGFVMWRIVIRYQREMDRALAAFDLTNLQFMTLAMAAWLGRSREAVTQTDLARFADIQPMQVSLMLKTLAAKGMITRRRSNLDTRAKSIEVTAAGLTALRHAFPVAIEVQRRLFGKEGRPGGRLLASLLALDSKVLVDTNQS